MKKLAIMIVDDQHLFAEGLKYVLLGEGGDDIDVVGIAENGKQAVDMVQRVQPEVILMDVRMPVMDGVKATEIIHRKYPDIRILILTTFDDDELAYHALSSGANGYVLKSIDPIDLLLSIKAVHKGVLYISPSVGFKLVKMMKHTEEMQHVDEKNIRAVIISKFPSLSVREVEVLGMVIEAERNKDIAAKLFIAEKTVKNHISSIYDKLGIHNRLRLISYINEIIVTSKNKLSNNL